MKLIVWLLFAVPMFGQDLRVTAAVRSNASTRAVFGKLPKQYSSALVGVCNQTEIAQTVPLIYAAQQLPKTNGITLLSRDEAISVIAAAQGGSKGATALRYSVAAVGLASVGSAFSGASQALKATLADVAQVGGLAIPIVANAIPTHTYLAFDHEALPDPLQLGAKGTATSCQAGLVLIEYIPGAKQVDFTMPLPAAKGQ